jgi:3-hydroxybutyryl-CoA dehydrogenase
MMDRDQQDDQASKPKCKGEASLISRIGIVGAGTMGSGIAQIAAQSGFDVVLIDQSESWLDRGLATISGNLDRLVSKEQMTGVRRNAILTRIEGSIRIDHVSLCDLVIEAVNESLPTKTEVFASVSDIVDPDVILVSNTSSISITALAGSVPNPGRVAGMHFFNPVPVMKLVEVISGLQTSDKTIASVTELAEQFGKTPVSVADAPGFVANRILLPMINEAVFCLAEGVASASDIDTVMKLGAAHPMGPLALADLIGLDVCLSILEVLHREFGDDKYRPAPMLRQMVSAGRLGRKSGIGFHDYGDA